MKAEQKRIRRTLSWESTTQNEPATLRDTGGGKGGRGRGSEL